MKKLIRKLIDYLFYNFFVDILEKNFRITIYLNYDNCLKKISMNYVPIAGSFIKLENGTFEVKKVTYATYGSIAYLEGNLILN